MTTSPKQLGGPTVNAGDLNAITDVNKIMCYSTSLQNKNLYHIILC